MGQLCTQRRRPRAWPYRGIPDTGFYEEKRLGGKMGTGNDSSPCQIFNEPCRMDHWEGGRLRRRGATPKSIGGGALRRQQRPESQGSRQHPRKICCRVILVKGFVLRFYKGKLTD